MSEFTTPNKSIPRDQEIQIRFALHAAGIGTWDVDMINRQIILDDRCRILFSLGDEEEPAYDAVFRHIHPADQHAVRLAVKATLHPDANHQFNVRFRSITADSNNTLWLNVKGQAYFNNEGQAIRLSGISQDITAEVAAQEKAEAAERMAAIAVEGSDAGIFTVDLINNTIDFSPNLCYIITGNRDTTVKDRDMLISHVHPEDRALRESAYEEAAHTGSLHYEARFVWDDGSIHWGKLRGKYFYDISGTPVSFSGICLDITAQKEQDTLFKEVEQRFSQEQQKLLSLVENSSDFIAVANLDGTITYVNDAGIKLMGLRHKASATTRNIRDIFTLERLAELERVILPSILETGRWTGRQYYTQQKTQELIPFHTNAFRLDNPINGEPIALACVSRDLRTELNVQQALLESEARFRSLVEEAPVATALFVGPAFVIEVANEPMIAFWGKGYSVLGKPLGVAVPELNDQPFMKILDDVYTSGISYHEKEAKSILIINGKPEIFYFNFTYKPLLNAAGEVYAIVDMTIDVTEQVLARNKLLEHQSNLEMEVAERTEELAASNEELAAMNEELQDANLSLVRSNQELEQYAYVASHDLQEPLRKIRIYADLLNKHEDLPIHHKRLIEKINQSSERMSMLIKDLLEFSRLLEKGNMMREIDLTIILQSVISDFELIVEEKNAAISIGPLPVIQGIPLQINQLFYNLMSNALKFTQPDVRPVISVSANILAADTASIHLGKSEQHKQYFDIAFSDNGIGFEQKYADQIFEVFKRLHNRNHYPGSGIGLSLCRRIVANHSGHLYVESTPDAGTTFHIIMPGF